MAISLDDLSVLRAVARAGGFRAAAPRVGLSASRLSDIVRRCEDRLGLRLFERNTRHVRPTDALVRLLDEAEGPLERLGGLIAAVSDTNTAPSGTLTIGAPVTAGPFLDPLAARYLRENPGVDIDLRYDDAVADMLDERIDLVLRSRSLLSPDHHSVPIGPPIRTCVVASPDYLRRRGTPADIDDVPDHDGVCFRLRSADRLAPWTFQLRDGAGSEPVVRMPRARVIVDSHPDLVALAKEGLGLAMVYADAVTDALVTGRLVEVLAGRTAELPGYHLAYLTKRHMPARVRAFVDLAKAERSGSR